MPHHRSTIKRLRSDATRRMRNRQVKTTVRTAAKKVRTAPDREQSAEAYRRFTSIVDKAVKKGVYRDRTASRMKSRLSKYAKPSA